MKTYTHPTFPHLEQVTKHSNGNHVIFDPISGQRVLRGQITLHKSELKSTSPRPLIRTPFLDPMDRMKLDAMRDKSGTLPTMAEVKAMGIVKRHTLIASHV